MTEIFEKDAHSREERLCDEVRRDFELRQSLRRKLEREWELNVRFFGGEQYLFLDSAGEITSRGKDYVWEQRRVFNHIAPIVDARLSKLSMIRPGLSVRAASGDDGDIRSAELASSILASVAEDCDLDGAISSATIWSELCGTAFYKIMWNSGAGRKVATRTDGGDIREGNVQIAVVSPFEIYPALLDEENLEGQPSIIHAKSVPVDKVYADYGVKVAGDDGGEDCVLLIERYEKPTSSRPLGRLTVTAGGKLLYDGDLPYINGGDGGRSYPFVMQKSIPHAGGFFGDSIVARLIPLQRAYNAVKNRKHEFLNRISVGTVAVEDGSVDVDELVESGLEPGKIIVYRQGGTPPEMLSLGSVPDEFWKEETSLLSEFNKISGVSDATETKSFSGVTSATGLKLLIEQSDARLNVSYEGLKRAIKSVGRHILRLFRQFATDVRLLRYAGKNGAVSLLCFKGSDISSDDVVLDADADSEMTPARRREAVFELLDRGLFSDADGKMSSAAKNRILELLGYSSFAGERDIGELQRERAAEENGLFGDGECEVKDYDDHAIHISEHTAYLLSGKPDAETERRVCAHLNEHKRRLKEDSRG